MAKRKKQECNPTHIYQEQNKEELQESDNMYRNLVERASDGTCIIQDNIVQYTNFRLAEMWGGTVKEVINTPFVDYIHPDEVQGLINQYKHSRIRGNY